MARSTRYRSRALLVALAGVWTMAASCGSDDPDTSNGADERPVTEATLAFVSPEPNETTAPAITVELRLDNGTVVDRTSGNLTSDEGHIHLSLDGRLVSMAFGTSQPLTDLTAGQHTLEAEFVAIDHAPFRNRVKAVVVFDVQA